MWKVDPQLRRCTSSRARWALFVTVILLLLEFSKSSSPNPRDSAASEVSPIRTRTPGKRRQRSPAGQQSATLSSGTPSPSSASRLRSFDTRSGASSSGSSPRASSKRLTEDLMNALSKSTDKYTNADLVYQWVDKQSKEGNAPESLLRSVIEVSDRQWGENQNPSSRTNILRTVANKLQLRKELGALVRESRMERRKRFADGPRKKLFTGSTSRLPTTAEDVARGGRPRARSASMSAEKESDFPREHPALFEQVEQVDDLKPPSPPTSALIPVEGEKNFESKEELRESPPSSPPASPLAVPLSPFEVEEPVDRYAKYSPPVASLLREIPPLYSGDIPDEALLEFSPYVGPGAWRPTEVDQDWSVDSSALKLDPSTAYDEKISEAASSVIQLLQEDDYSVLGGDTDTEELEQSKDLGSGGPAGDKSALEVQLEPELLQAPATFVPNSDSAISISSHRSDTTEAQQSVSPADIDVPMDSGVRTSTEDSSLVSEPQRVMVPARGRREPHGMNFVQRSWETSKAVGREHKGKLKVVGVLLMIAALVGGLVVANKKMKRRVPISSPLLTTVDSKKCHVLIDFEKGHGSKYLGRVASVEEVRVDNSNRIVTVSYLERPAIRTSRGRDFFRWLKYRVSLGKALTLRKEKLVFPSACMGGAHSGFQVAEEAGKVQRLLVDLDRNPGPLTVPRQVLSNDSIDDMLSSFETDANWRPYSDCVMHITIDRPFHGSPIVQVETASGRVTFQNPELRHLTSALPRECEWRQPWNMRLIYKIDGAVPLDVLLMMTAAETPVPEEERLRRMPGSATLDHAVAEDDVDDGFDY